MVIPSGCIVIWSGSIASIPSGWYLCNGSNGTPDLRNKFIVGAGSTYAVGASGGNTTHTHTFTTNSHDHTSPAGIDLGSGAAWNRTTDAKTDSGTTDSASSLPPYYALAFIMKG